MMIATRRFAAILATGCVRVRYQTMGISRPGEIGNDGFHSPAPTDRSSRAKVG